MQNRGTREFQIILAGAILAAFLLFPTEGADPIGGNRSVHLLQQTLEEEQAKSEGCLSCHAGIEPMHASPSVRLGCIDCHGGLPKGGI